MTWSAIAVDAVQGSGPHPRCVDASAPIHPVADARYRASNERHEQPESEGAEGSTAHREPYQRVREMLQLGFGERDHG